MRRFQAGKFAEQWRRKKREKRRRITEYDKSWGKFYPERNVTISV